MGNATGWLIKFARSSIGGKILMGLTGAVLVLFIVAHMIGNFLTFAGQDAFNTYAHAMQSKPAFVWLLRSGLLVVTGLHVLQGIRLSLENRRARPQGYAVNNFKAAKGNARRMFASGVLLLVFIVYHLMHFTAGVIKHSDYDRWDALGRHDAYSMFVLGFQDPLVAGSYILAMLFLFAHLAHGIASMFQSLGLRSPKWEKLIDRAGFGLALILILGNISMPVAVMAGLIKLPAGV